MPKRTKSYHEWLIRRLTNPLEAQRYLRTAMEDSPSHFFKALGNVAEANRMAKVAEQIGVNRESLYRSLSETGNPGYRTVESVLNAIGMAFDLRLLQPPTATPPTGQPALEATSKIGFSSGGNTGISMQDADFRGFTLVNSMQSVTPEEDLVRQIERSLSGRRQLMRSGQQRQEVAAGD